MAASFRELIWATGILMSLVLFCTVMLYDKLARRIDETREPAVIQETALTLFACNRGDDENPGTSMAPIRTFTEAGKRMKRGTRLYLCEGSDWHEPLPLGAGYMLVTSYFMDDNSMPRASRVSTKLHYDRPVAPPVLR